MILSKGIDRKGSMQGGTREGDYACKGGSVQGEGKAIMQGGSVQGEGARGRSVQGEGKVIMQVFREKGR